MGEGYYGVSDEFIMYFVVPVLLMVVVLPIKKWMDRYGE